MAKDPMDTSSVRVEFDAGFNVASPGPLGRRAITVMVAGILAVGVVVVLLRPDSGSNAVGNPVGESAGEVTVPPPPVIEEATAPSPEEVAPIDFERVPLRGSDLHSALEVEGGWIALLESTLKTEVVRSTDGLDWEPLNQRQFPGGILGYGRVDDDLLVAISASLAASVETEIQIWRLDDQDQWQRAEEFGAYRTEGRAFGATFSPWGISILVSAARPDPEPLPLAGELLDGLLPAHEAALVCAAERVAGGEQASGLFLGLEFRDCAGNPIATVPDEFLAGRGRELAQCFDLLFNSISERNEVVRFSRDEPPVVVGFEPLDRPSSFITTVDGLIVATFSSMEGCEELDDTDSLQPRVQRWSRAGGLVASGAELPPDSRFGFFSIESRSDGAILLVTLLAVYETTDRLEDFEVLIEAPQVGRIRPVVDGRRFFIDSRPWGAGVSISDEDGRLQDIELGSLSNKDLSFVLATESYVVMLDQSGPVRELVKIPLQSG